MRQFIIDAIARVAGFQSVDRARIIQTINLLGYLDDSLYLTKASKDAFRQRLIRNYVNPDDMEFVLDHCDFFIFICRLNNLIEYYLIDRSLKIFYTVKYSIRQFFRPAVYKLKVNALSGKEFNEYDDILFYSAFETLVQFVEVECHNDAKYRSLELDPNDIPGYVSLKTHSDADRKALAGLYWWYKHVHLRRRYAGEEFISDELANEILGNNQSKGIVHHSRFDLVAETDAQFYRVEEQQMLLKLCDLRHVMWA